MFGSLLRRSFHPTPGILLWLTHCCRLRYPFIFLYLSWLIRQIALFCPFALDWSLWYPSPCFVIVRLWGRIIGFSIFSAISLHFSCPLDGSTPAFGVFRAGTPHFIHNITFRVSGRAKYCGSAAWNLWLTFRKSWGYFFEVVQWVEWEWIPSLIVCTSSVETKHKVYFTHVGFASSS